MTIYKAVIAVTPSGIILNSEANLVSDVFWTGLRDVIQNFLH